MSSSDSSSSQHRREFLARLATAGAVVAGTSLASPLAATVAASEPDTRRRPAWSDTSSVAPFDDAWTDRVRAAKYRAVFDSPGVEDGLALEQATIYWEGYKAQFGIGAPEVVPVIVMRHMGTAMAFNDAIWKKYALGAFIKVNDPATSKPAERNIFTRANLAAKDPIIPVEASPESLIAAGAVILVCNKATRHFAAAAAKEQKRDVEEVYAELRAGVLPGLLLQPSGVYATLRAQDAGCSFMRSA